jgi:hypothetical protein
LDEPTLYHGLKMARCSSESANVGSLAQIEHVSEEIRKFSRNRDRVAVNP